MDIQRSSYTERGTAEELPVSHFKALTAYFHITKCFNKITCPSSSAYPEVGQVVVSVSTAASFSCTVWVSKAAETCNLSTESWVCPEDPFQRDISNNPPPTPKGM